MERRQRQLTRGPTDVRGPHWEGRPRTSVRFPPASSPPASSPPAPSPPVPAPSVLSTPA
ncbi:hypothetical protein KPATCC21470_5518 [Kitasatospora purpeofusca]